MQGYLLLSTVQASQHGAWLSCIFEEDIAVHGKYLISHNRISAMLDLIRLYQFCVNFDLH